MTAEVPTRAEALAAWRALDEDQRLEAAMLLVHNDGYALREASLSANEAWRKSRIRTSAAYAAGAAVLATALEESADQLRAEVSRLRAELGDWHDAFPGYEPGEGLSIQEYARRLRDSWSRGDDR